MGPKRKLSGSKRNYSEKIIYPDKVMEDSKKREYQGGIYSDSAFGGASQDQQNPWQGSQDQAKSERP